MAASELMKRQSQECKKPALFPSAKFIICHGHHQRGLSDYNSCITHRLMQLVLPAENRSYNETEQR